MVDEVETVFPVEMQRRLTIGLGRELLTCQLRAQLDIVVNLAVRDQDGPARFVERLIAGLQIDDGESGLAQPAAPSPMSRT